ncbi:MAG: glycosyltransferase [Candidatus Caldatribacteriaceae bacterium]
MFKLHIGCGERKLSGFVNIDKDGDPDLKIDVRYGLPFPNESVDFIFAEHFIEHLTRDEGILFLREAYRVLKRGGICRLATPNLATQTENYINDTWREAEWIHRFGYEWIPNRCVMFNIALREWGHQYLYDFEDLEMVGNLAGFLICEKKGVGESNVPYLQNLEHRSGSLVVEFTKESKGHCYELPLVSICIPAYNSRFFREALLSALSQTYLNCEIVICDDSPGEEIERITKSFKDDRIRYYKNPRTMGAWKNYLQLISRAQGKYVKYLNDDDILHPECVKSMVSYMEAYKDRVSLITSKRNMIDEKGNLLPDIYSTRLLSDRDFYVLGIDFGNLALSQAVNVIGEPTTVMFRREDATEFERLFHYFYEGNRGVGDVFMWLCLLSKGDAIYLSQPFSFFRQHPEQSQRDPSIAFVLVKSWYYLVTKSRLLGFLKRDGVYREALRNLIRVFRYYLDHFAFTSEESQDLSGTIEEIEKELQLLTDIDGASYQIRIHPIIRNASILQPTQTALEVQYQCILELVQKKFIVEAIEALKALIQQFPHFTEALNDLGVLYFSQGDVTGATEVLEECLRRDPKNVLAIENLRDIYVTLGKTQKAEYYNAMLESIKNDQEVSVQGMDFSSPEKKVDAI